MYELELQRNMTPDQRLMFQSEFNMQRKDTTVAILLAIFLGGFGAHHFYLGRIGLGILYLCLFWTGIIFLVAWIECFFMSERVRRWNDAKAYEIAQRVLYITPTHMPAPPSVAPVPVAPAAGSVYCTKCGTPMPLDARFCAKCGTLVPTMV